MDHPHRHLKGGRRRGKLLGTALVAASVTLAWTAGTGVAAAGTAIPAYDVPTAAQAGMKTLMGSYNSSTGLIGNSWWQSAVALSTLMTYAQATGDTQYDYAISAAFNDNKSGNFENTYMDDTGWWGVAWLQAYQMTGNTQYLQMAETTPTTSTSTGTPPAAAGCGGPRPSPTRTPYPTSCSWSSAPGCTTSSPATPSTWAGPTRSGPGSAPAT